MRDIDELIRTLSRIRKAEEGMRMEVLRLKTKAQGVGAQRYDGVKTKTLPKADKMENATIELQEVLAGQAKAKREHRMIRLEASTLFWSIDDHAASQILDWHYTYGMSLREVAYESGMSIEWVNQKIRKGKRDIWRKRNNNVTHRSESRTCTQAKDDL